MRTITKVYLSLAVLLVIAAGANQYWAWKKIQREEQTVPFRAQVEEEIKNQNLPYKIVDVDIKEYANALGAKYVRMLPEGGKYFDTLTFKNPTKFVHAISHQKGKKNIYKALAPLKIPMRYDNKGSESQYGAEGRFSANIQLTHPSHVYWAGGFDGEELVVYHESYLPPPSSLPHGGAGSFKALSEQGVTFKYADMYPFGMAWAITGPLLVIAYFTAWGPWLFPWSRPRKSKPQIEGEKMAG